MFSASRAAALVVSVAACFAASCSAERASEEGTISQPPYAARRMPDGKEWMTGNLNVSDTAAGCYEGNQSNCDRYGRLYTWEAAQRACSSLGNGWRLPSADEWRALTTPFGGIGDGSTDGGKAAYAALLDGGTSGFGAVMGGGRQADGQYARVDAHGFYWTASEHDADHAVFYNFGKGSQALYRQPQGDKRMALSVRCVRD